MKTINLKSKYLYLILFSNFLCCLFICLNKEHLNKDKLKLSILTVIILFLVEEIIYILFYFYTNFIYKKIKIKSIKINYKFMNYFIFFVLLENFLFSYFFNIGKSVNSTPFKYGFLYSMFPINSLFLIYFSLTKKINKFIFINLILYISYSFYLGWSGFVVPIFFMILEKDYQNNRVKNIICKNIFTIFLVLGPFLYKILSSIKFYIRFNYFAFSFSYINSLIKMINRFSSFQIIPYILENIETIDNIMKKIGYYDYLFRSILLIIPKQIFNINYDPNSCLNKKIVTDLIEPLDKYTSLEVEFLGNILAYGFNSFIYVIYIILLITSLIILAKKLGVSNWYILFLILSFLRVGDVGSLIFPIYGISLCIILNIIMRKISNCFGT